ncbi:ATP-binding protein [Caldithrix abyssi]
MEAIEKIIKEKIRYIFIDEIQRIPLLLNEVHYLIEEFPGCQFIMTGSSARKLRRGGVNLLAGRALERQLFPFTYQEIKESMNLEDLLKYGSLPPLLEKNNTEKREILNAYVNTYLREEIQAEGIARNIGGFSRFLDVAASQFTELLNFNAIARDCALPVRTVQSYYEILEDTLIGFRLLPWRKSVRKRLRAHPKFYFFDNGVTNALNGMLTSSLAGAIKGKLFEQFVIQEVYRFKHYLQSEANLFFWRTNHGAEVDLLIEKHRQIKYIVEIKVSTIITGAHLSGIRAFHEENPDVPAYIVAPVDQPYELEGVKILPWQHFVLNLENFL